MTTTVGKVILKHVLPVGLDTFVDETTLDKKGIMALFQRLATEYPEQYGEIVSTLTRLGFEVATREGSSLKLTDLLSPIDKDKMLGDFIDRSNETRKGKESANKKADKIFADYATVMDKMNKDVVSEGLKADNTLAKIVTAGSRGDVSQLRSTIVAPGIVLDQNQKPLLDFPVVHSFAEGLSMPEYLATSWGTRYGAASVKVGTAKGGYVGKSLSRALMPARIEEHDCGTMNGIMYPVSDRDNIGCYLAHPAGNYNRNSEVTQNMLATLAKKGIAEICVRSPITCEASKNHHFAAICQLCAGRREKGLPELKSYVGVVAGSAIGEPLAQSALSAKHQSGSASKINLVGGFELVNQLLNIPKTFKDKAAIASKDGTVDAIHDVAAGGKFIVVNGEEHYVPTDFPVFVKVGDKVEAGDVMSEGIPNPADIVAHKGIGAGRKYYVKALKKAMDDAGMAVARRNFEVVAKGAVDHVKITNPEGIGNFLPDQIVPYESIAHDYEPRSSSAKRRVDLALNQYLEAPAMHYTIGTRVTPTVAADLKAHGIESVMVHPEPPPFEPVMQRILDVPVHAGDIFHTLYTDHIENRLADAINRGIGNSSNIKGPSPIAGLAYAKGFGDPE